MIHNALLNLLNQRFQHDSTLAIFSVERRPRV
jgi:hypothetical protein